MSRPRRSAATVTSALTLAGLGLALAACGGGSSTAQGTTPGASSSGSTTSAGGASHVSITLASAGSGDECTADTTSVPAGPVTFTVTNQSAAGITELELLNGEKIMGEKENLAPGLPAASFTLTLGGGTYTIYCPGASSEKTPLTVTGQAIASPAGSAAQLLQKGADQYASYVTTQVDGMVTAVATLRKDVDSGDLTAAQRAYGDARPFYEKIESDVEGFVVPGGDPTNNADNLDYLIDMRASNLDPKVGWSGFHAIERDLFASRRITAQTKRYAAGLTKNVAELAKQSKTLTYKPEDLANGAAGLLEEVQTNKISGEEEKYSHTDLVDFASNVEGAQQAFLNLKPGLAEIDADLTRTIAQRFDAVNAMLDTYRDPAAVGGYRPYTAEVRAADANTLSQTVQSLQDALAHLAEKVATA